MVEIPASLTGTIRKRPSFHTRAEADEHADQFRLKALAMGSKVAAESNTQSVRSAWAEFKESKLPDASKPEREALNVNENRIIGAFGALPLDLVKPAAVDRWLKGKEWSKRTRFNAFSYLRTFLRWCNRRGKLDGNSLEAIEALADEIRKPPAPKAIISAEEMEILLELTKKNAVMRAAFVLGGFAGIRTKEILLMTWNLCDFEAEEIHVTKDIIKATEQRGGMRERYVKMLPAFLKHIPRELTGKIVDVGSKGFRDRRTRLLSSIRAEVEKRGLPDAEKWNKWPSNCLRHTYASALLATTKDAWKVAHELGHTNTKTIHQDYARAMKEKEALAYFNL